MRTCWHTCGRGTGSELEADMHPLELKGHTRRLAAPDGWDHARFGICHTLEIRDENGWMLSAWEPSPAERKILAAGRPLVLWVMWAPCTRR